MVQEKKLYPYKPDHKLEEKDILEYGKEVRAATLKEMGRWLDKRLCCGGHGQYGGQYHKVYMELKESEIEALLRGEMPKETSAKNLSQAESSDMLEMGWIPGR